MSRPPTADEVNAAIAAANDSEDSTTVHDALDIIAAYNESGQPPIKRQPVAARVYEAVENLRSE